MTLGEAVMEALSAWDGFSADEAPPYAFLTLEGAMDRLRIEVAGVLDADLKRYTPSMGDPYPIEKLRAMQAQEAERER